MELNLIQISNISMEVFHAQNVERNGIFYITSKFISSILDKYSHNDHMDFNKFTDYSPLLKF